MDDRQRLNQILEDAKKYKTADVLVRFVFETTTPEEKIKLFPEMENSIKEQLRANKAYQRLERLLGEKSDEVYLFRKRHKLTYQLTRAVRQLQEPVVVFGDNRDFFTSNICVRFKDGKSIINDTDFTKVKGL